MACSQPLRPWSFSEPATALRPAIPDGLDAAQYSTAQCLYRIYYPVIGLLLPSHPLWDLFLFVTQFADLGYRAR